MTWDFFRERKVTARKPHTCMECGPVIQPGDRYSYGFGKCEGEPMDNVLCLTCRALVDAAERWFRYDDGWPSPIREELADMGVSDWRAWLVWAQVSAPVRL